MAQVNTIHPGNPITDPTEKGVRTSSNIPFVYRQFITQRFADLQPCLGFEYVPKDDIEFKPEYDLRTYTLGAPLMSDVFFHRDYFTVDMQAILPKNWAKVYTNPLIGDDVQPIVNSFVNGSDLRDIIYSTASAFAYNQYVVGGDVEVTYIPLADQIRALIWLSLWFSQGSLLSSLDYKFSKHFRAVKPIGSKNRRDFDSFYQERIKMVYDRLHDYQTTSKALIPIRFYDLSNQIDFYYLQFEDIADIEIDDQSELTRIISFRRFLELAFQNMNFDFPLSEQLDYNFDVEMASGSDLPALNNDSDGWLDAWNLSLGSMFPDFNFGKIAAYQLCCAHFYSNDHVDYIYSADLFRQLIWSYVMADVSSDDRSFSYNGVQTEYDALSGAMMLYQIVTDADFVDGAFGDILPVKLAYWTALLSFRKSLRFVDYFTGAKAYPLAVGDVSVEVNANLVNIIDVTKNIQKQRFLNAVNRSGRKVQDYMQGIFGIAPDPDHHDPLFLTNIKDPIHLEEVDNTGEAQQTEANSVTGILRGNNSQFAFSFKTALPGYLIGIAHFDIPRAYAHHYLKENMHSDRYDMFNPDMQFIGDQAISRAELGVGDKDDPFGYTLRYMEYKIRTDSAAGGFACPDILPGYCFLADNVRGLETPSHISPDYIRSKNVEMDEFYPHLTGYGLADYFHFQIKHVNIIDSRRPMAYAPSIL